MYRINWEHADATIELGEIVFPSKKIAIQVARSMVNGSAFGEVRKALGYTRIWVDSEKTDCGVWSKPL